MSRAAAERLHETQFHSIGDSACSPEIESFVLYVSDTSFAMVYKLEIMFQ